MILNKVDLDFLKVFNLGNNNMPDLQICLSNGVLLFIQDLGESRTFRKMEVESMERFNFLVNTASFVNLINKAPKGEIEIADGTIKFLGFNTPNEYNLECKEETIYPTLEELTPARAGCKMIKLTDIPKLAYSKQYTGSDSDDTKLHAISLIDKYCMASNRSVGVVIETGNSQTDFEQFYIPKSVVSLWEKHAGNEIVIYVNDERDEWFFEIMEATVVLAIQDFNVPDLLADDYREQYAHPTKAILQKSDLLQVLKLMQVVSKEVKQNRITLQFEQDKVTVINKDWNNNISRHSISATVDPALVGNSVRVSSNYMAKQVSDLPGSNVFLYAPLRGSNASAVSIQDESHKITLMSAMPEEEFE